MALEIRVGDLLRMKKAHPCGNDLWTVGRLGSDIGMTCQKCGRHILLARTYLDRRGKEIIARPEQGLEAEPISGIHPSQAI